MKRKVLLFAVVVAVVSLLASCKTHERCPAYGKINKNNVEKTVKSV
jgi:hypothetical protein